MQTATLPKWFAVTTIVFGVVSVLGPLAFAVYLLLPLWLVAASIVTAHSTKATTHNSTIPMSVNAY